MKNEAERLDLKCGVRELINVSLESARPITHVRHGEICGGGNPIMCSWRKSAWQWGNVAMGRVVSSSAFAVFGVKVLRPPTAAVFNFALAA